MPPGAFVALCTLPFIALAVVFAIKTERELNRRARETREDRE